MREPGGCILLPGIAGRPVRGLAVAPSDPGTLAVGTPSGVFRSDDGGERWRKVTDKGRFGNRPFYYADLRVDPKDPERVYSLWSTVSVSIDGGKTFENDWTAQMLNN